MTAQLRVIENDRLREIAPAAFTTRRNPDMSAKYIHVPTMEVVELLSKAGYRVTQAAQDKPSHRNPAYVQHRLTLTHKSKLRAKLHETIPQVNIFNSGNGRTTFSMLVGFYRLICENGMIGGHNFAALKIIHMRDIEEQLADCLKVVTAQTTRGLEVIDTWKNIHLPIRSTYTLAKMALVLRFGEEGAKAVDFKQLLDVRRDVDAGDDLWRVFNRVQENIIRGGFKSTSANNRITTMREIKAVATLNTVNRGLWDVAEKLAA